MDVNNEYGFFELHKSLLCLLDEFNDLCTKQGIKYSLGYGSMLGAVRHKGIIPWDDDLDIIIDRKNYNVLLTVLSNVDNLIVQRNYQSTLWIDKIRFTEKTEFKYEPTIDIFVIDNVPNNRLAGKIKLYLILFVQGMIKMSIFSKKGTFLEKMASLLSACIGIFFPIKMKIDMYRKISTWGNHSITKKVANYNVEYMYVRKEYDSNLLTNIEEVPFDTTKAYISSGYNLYLSTLYGDYMTPPQDKSPKHAKKQ